MAKIERIGVLSFGKINGVIGAVFGLIVGIFFSLIFSFIPMTPEGADFPSLMFGTLSIVFLPIMYGLIGFLFGILFAFIYNIVVKWTGGLEIEIKR